MNHLHQRLHQESNYDDDGYDDDVQSDRLQRYEQLMRRLFLRLYPAITAVIDGSNFICQWKFLLGQTVFFDSTSLLMNQVVRRITQEDMNKQEKNGSNNIVEPSSLTASSQENDLQKIESDNTRSSAAAAIWKESTASTSAIRKSVIYLISASIAVSWLTQLCVEWRNQRDQQHRRRRRQIADEEGDDQNRNTTQRRSSTDDISIPPPPPPPPPKSSKGLQSNAGQCPLCQKTTKNPTAVSTSGYVFCFTCIKKQIEEHGKCPVTSMPCSKSQLVRLFEPRH